MFSNTVAGEVIGTSLRHLALFAVWVVLVVAVVAVLVTGVRALRRRQGSGLRDQAADREAITRPAFTRHAWVRRGSWIHPPGPRPSIVSRRKSAADKSRVPVQSS
jgi:hypothetical protein